jgi:alcohol dehydrogenase class IV
MEENSDSFDAIWNFFSPNRVMFGPGAASQTGAIVRMLGGETVLIITSPVISKMGLVKGVEESLRSEKIRTEIYDREDREPTVRMIEDCGAYVCRKRFDLLVGVGGGSIIDLTKMVSILATHGGKILDYEGLDKVPGKGLPKIFIPTTAGAGAEVTRMAGATDESNAKRDVSSTFNLADVVILDPLLTLSLPKRLTAEIGIDGLSHAIEAYVALGATPFSEITALEAIRLIHENLPGAYAQGDDLKARAGMQLASALSGLALGAGKLGAVHGLAFALEAVSNLPHAKCIGIMLPHAMEANLTGSPRKFADIARMMGESMEGLSLLDAARKSVTAVKRLLKNLDISIRLSDYGIPKEKLSDLVKYALRLSWWFEPNPRRLDEEEIKAIFAKAFQ